MFHGYHCPHPLVKKKCIMTSITMYLLQVTHGWEVIPETLTPLVQIMIITFIETISDPTGSHGQIADSRIGKVSVRDQGLHTLGTSNSNRNRKLTEGNRNCCCSIRNSNDTKQHPDHIRGDKVKAMWDKLR